MPPMAQKKKPSAGGGKKPKRTGKPLHVWLLPALRDAIEQLADENRRPLTTEVAIALEAHLKAAGKWPPLSPRTENTP